MRVLGGAVIVAAVVGGLVSASSASTTCATRINDSGVTVTVCRGNGTTTYGGGGGGSGGGGGREVSYDGHVLLVYSVGSDDTGQPCLASTMRSSPTPFPDRVRTDTAATNAAIVSAGHPPCPGAASVDPVQIVLAHLSEHGPPDPDPVVPSGFGITGLEAIVVTDNTPVTWSDAVASTPFGPLDLTGRAAVDVDWGDGTTTGPFGEPGRPFPDHNIWHVYTDLAVVDVVVTYTWTIDWSFGAAAGQVTLNRTGTVAGFEVVDVQSVVTYGGPD